MMALGTVAPSFSLPDVVSGEVLSLGGLKGGKGTLIMFICNHCPYVKHINSALAKMGRDYQGSGISIVAISANDVENYPQDGPEAMKQNAQQEGFNFPYLYDESQALARAYDAACTPDFFLFDENLKCVYRGQFDDSRPGNEIAVTGADLRAAMNALLQGKAISSDQRVSIGCNIKWKSG